LHHLRFAACRGNEISPGDAPILALPITSRVFANACVAAVTRFTSAPAPLGGKARADGVAAPEQEGPDNKAVWRTAQGMSTSIMGLEGNSAAQAGQ